ncbi:hypothetical protein PR048_029479 [Dryococelus australis]|uniref:Uncharacterized protein n=1 Tax=Dryococelus australis TaxID=614101 RepID=A0ABQ9GDG8_9NEOP|nr:hypothetical protein PR048_029479 [Dryococelus australis]
MMIITVFGSYHLVTSKLPCRITAGVLTPVYGYLDLQITIDSELHCLTLSPDLVIIGLSPTKANQVRLPGWITRVFVRGNRAGRCRWSAGILGYLPFTPPPVLAFQRCSISPHFTLVALKISTLRAAQISPLHFVVHELRAESKLSELPQSALLSERRRLSDCNFTRSWFGKADTPHTSQPARPCFAAVQSTVEPSSPGKYPGPAHPESSFKPPRSEGSCRGGGRGSADEIHAARRLSVYTIGARGEKAVSWTQALKKLEGANRSKRAERAQMTVDPLLQRPEGDKENKGAPCGPEMKALYTNAAGEASLPLTSDHTGRKKKLFTLFRASCLSVAFRKRRPQAFLRAICRRRIPAELTRGSRERNTDGSRNHISVHVTIAYSRGRSGVVVRLLASHLGEPGSIPGGAIPGASHARIEKSYRTMPLVAKFSRSSIASSALAIRRCSILASFHSLWLSRLEIERIWHTCDTSAYLAANNFSCQAKRIELPNLSRIYLTYNLSSPPPYKKEGLGVSKSRDGSRSRVAEQDEWVHAAGLRVEKGKRGRRWRRRRNNPQAPTTAAQMAVTGRNKPPPARGSRGTLDAEQQQSISPSGILSSACNGESCLKPYSHDRPSLPTVRHRNLLGRGPDRTVFTIAKSFVDRQNHTRYSHDRPSLPTVRHRNLLGRGPDRTVFTIAKSFVDRQNHTRWDKTASSQCRGMFTLHSLTAAASVTLPCEVCYPRGYCTQRFACGQVSGVKHTFWHSCPGDQLDRLHYAIVKATGFPRRYLRTTCTPKRMSSDPLPWQDDSNCRALQVSGCEPRALGVASYLILIGPVRQGTVSRQRKLYARHVALESGLRGYYAVVRRQQCSPIGLTRPEPRPQPYRTSLGRIGSPGEGSSGAAKLHCSTHGMVARGMAMNPRGCSADTRREHARQGGCCYSRKRWPYEILI